jgi:hypothetical protein
MISNNSFQRFDIAPAAILWDGVLPVPLYAVTQMTLTETYHLPPIGSAGARAIVSTHDDTVALSASLVGLSRFAMKAALETMAESSKRGTRAFVVGPKMNGLVLVTAMTIRTDMQIQTLTFSATVTRRQTLDVQMTLAYMPSPGIFGKLLDLGSIGIGALADLGN